MTEGVDFSLARPGGATLVKAGKHFVIRYTSQTPGATGNGGKRLNASEVRDYRAAGLDIGLVWETTTGRATAGFAAGRADAQSSAATAAGLGVPAAVAHYFAVDQGDITGPQVAEYFKGAASVLGLPLVGVYGGLDVVGYLLDHHLVTFAWQTYAWSHGQWDPRAHVQQYHNGVNIGGDVDLDRSMVADWGQWKAVEEVVLGQDDIDAVAKAVWKLMVGNSGLDTAQMLQSIYNASTNPADPNAIEQQDATAAAVVKILPPNGGGNSAGGSGTFTWTANP